MRLLDHGLRGALAPAPTAAREGAPAPRRVLVIGAAGPLGGQVLTALLAGGRLAGVLALVSQSLGVAMQGLQAWQVDGRFDAQVPGSALPAHTDTAVLVFDREGSRHGREAAFVRPQPAQLPALAAWLQALGVRRLVLVLPHAPGLLPQALRAGLASVDEQSVAALGFDQLVLVRAARAEVAAPGHGLSAPARLAQALLTQLQWLVPQREQAMRAARVAELVAALVRGLPSMRHGTRVLAPEQLWDWAQPGGGAPWLDAWLQDAPLPLVATPARRW